MKKLIAIATMLASGAAVAVNSSNVFGILRVDSSQPETIISVPWIAADSVTANIKVADLVLTSNLTKDDMLYYYNGTTSFEYEAWVLTETTIGGEATKVWSPVTTVSQAGITAGEHAGTRAVPRGGALFLVRQNYNNEPIYLYGRHTTVAASVTVAKGSPETTTSPASRAYTLLAPSNPNGVDLNAKNSDGTNKYMSGTPSVTDFILIESGEPLTYRKLGTNGAWEWGVYKKTGRTTYTWDTSKAVIKPGRGCWYVSEGGEPTFNW